jgi:hypothetical protein
LQDAQIDQSFFLTFNEAAYLWYVAFFVDIL